MKDNFSKVQLDTQTKTKTWNTKWSIQNNYFDLDAADGEHFTDSINKLKK